MSAALSLPLAGRAALVGAAAPDAAADVTGHILAIDGGYPAT